MELEAVIGHHSRPEPVRYRNRRDDQDDRDHDQEFDQRKTAGFTLYTHVHLLLPMHLLHQIEADCL
jgi:hypothetical protein